MENPWFPLAFESVPSFSSMVFMKFHGFSIHFHVFFPTESHSEGAEVGGRLMTELKSSITLAAMRCVLRTLTSVPLGSDFVEVMSEAGAPRAVRLGLENLWSNDEFN